MTLHVQFIFTMHGTTTILLLIFIKWHCDYLWLKLGLASAPTALNILDISITGLGINFSIPEYGSVCVDEYRVSINASETQTPGNLTLNRTLSVANVSQRVYTQSFAVEALCRNVLMNAYITALAVTNGLKGASTSKNVIDSVHRVTLTSQMFTRSGMINVFIFQVNFHDIDSASALCINSEFIIVIL